MDLTELMERAREDADASIWSKGVSIARSGAVQGYRQAKDELEFRVARPLGASALAVFVYPDDADWACDCPSTSDICPHAVACLITLKQQGVDALFSEHRAGPQSLRYELVTSSGRLSLRRKLTDETLVEGRLGRLRDRDATVLLHDHDWKIERALGAGDGDPLPKGAVFDVLEGLARVEALTLDGRSIEIGDPHPGLRAVVEDVEEGIRVRLEQHPDLKQTFENGALRIGDHLHAHDQSLPLSSKMQALRHGKLFSHDAIPEFVTRWLPYLRARLPVHLSTQKLRDTVRVPPRIHLDIEETPSGLTVLPLLVYGDPILARVDGDTLKCFGADVPIRDEARERSLAHRLQQKLGLSFGQRMTAEGDEALTLAETLRTFDDTRDQAALDAYRLAGVLEAYATADTASGMAFRLPGGSGQVDPTAVVDAWQRGESALKLPMGGFASLPSDWLAQHGMVLRDLVAGIQAAGALTPALQTIRSELEDHLEGAPQRVWEAPSNARPPRPSIQVTLRPYQETGVEWLWERLSAGIGCLLCDDMGLGKTIQALSVATSKTLVVAPTSLLENWRRECRKVRPDLRVGIYHGADRSLSDHDLVITSYALLRLDLDTLRDVPWSTVILDEAHTIKNPDSQTAQAAFALSAPNRLTLSGTPIENRPEELWSQMHFCNPGLLGSRNDFKQHYAAPMTHPDAAIALPAAVALKERIHPFVLRRRKEMVARDLPPRTDAEIWCELSSEEHGLYQRVAALTVPEVLSQLETDGNVLGALEALLRLRQAACHPALLPESWGAGAMASTKLSVLVEKLSELIPAGHKALVFSQWTSLLDQIEPALNEAQLSFARIDGATQNRGQVVDAFQAEGGPPILLASLKAGGVGLNLTAADHVFIMDPWWNPATEEQAADRAHRIGQERPVFVYRLLAQNTVEEAVFALQAQKRELAAAVLDGREQPFQALRNELIDLLRDAYQAA